MRIENNNNRIIIYLYICIKYDLKNIKIYRNTTLSEIINLSYIFFKINVSLKSLKKLL